MTYRVSGELPLAPLECDLKMRKCRKCNTEIVWVQRGMRFIPVDCEECDHE